MRFATGVADDTLFIDRRISRFSTESQRPEFAVSGTTRTMQGASSSWRQPGWSYFNLTSEEIRTSMDVLLRLINITWRSINGNMLFYLRSFSNNTTPGGIKGANKYTILVDENGVSTIKDLFYYFELIITSRRISKVRDA